MVEWEETEVDLINDNPSSMRGVCGGGWFLDSSFMNSSTRLESGPTDEGNGLGFRVVSLTVTHSLARRADIEKLDVAPASLLTIFFCNRSSLRTKQ